MGYQVLTEELEEVRDCPDCGEHAVHLAFKPHSFMYGSENSVELTAVIPVWTCEACGFSYTDGRGEEIEHAAICQHLKVLSPQEIRDLRERHGLSRAELVELCRFGEASVKRWETGSLIQNAAADRFLRLIDDPDVLKTLRRLDQKLKSDPGLAASPHFPVRKFSPKLVSASQLEDISTSTIGGQHSAAGSASIDRHSPAVHNIDFRIAAAPKSIEPTAQGQPDESAVISNQTPQKFVSFDTPQGSCSLWDDGNIVYVQFEPRQMPTELLVISQDLFLDLQRYDLIPSSRYPSFFEVNTLKLEMAARFELAYQAKPHHFSIRWE